jgi:hypothetical protein
VTAHPHTGEAERTHRDGPDLAPPGALPSRLPGTRQVVAWGVARAHLLVPALLTAALALRAGGFFPAAPAVLALVMALLLLVRITLVERPWSGWSPAVAVSAGALALLAGWTLLSAVWSHAPARAMTEFDRTLAYVLVLAFMSSFVPRAGDLDRALRLVALAVGAIAAAALLTRLYPATFPIGVGRSPARLAFPLTYWNALGVFCAIGLTLALHCSAAPASGPVARVLAAGSLPVTATTLYFTFSRGGIAVAALGVVAYVALAHPRRLPVALLASGVPVYLAVRAAYGAGGLATSDFARFPGQAHDVAVAVGGAALGAMALRALGLLADRRIDAIHVTRRLRRRVLLGSAAAGLAALAVVSVAADLPARVEDQVRRFPHARVSYDADQRARLGDIGANGRLENWRVALDAFQREPLHGTGAGTYRLEWQAHRPIDLNVTDGHSLYLETLGELGWPGLALLLVALLVPAGLAARRLFGPERHAHGAFLAAGLALLVHAGVDWDWEMPALFAWFLGTAGVVLAARPGRGRLASPGRLTRVVAGLGCLLLVVGPASVALSQRALDGATRAFKVGDCAVTTDKALDSLDALSVRPEPFELLGYCNLRARRDDLAIRAFDSARARDPHAWTYAYGLAVAQALGGLDPRPMARLARSLNPRDELAQDLVRAMRRGGPRHWARAAARAQIPFE